MLRLLGLGWFLYQLLKTSKPATCESIDELKNQGLTDLQAKREARAQRAEQRMNLNTQLRVVQAVGKITQSLVN